MNREFDCGLELFGRFVLAMAFLLVCLPYPAHTCARSQQASDVAVLARVPMRVLANAPYIDARINDHGPFTFGLDTGSINSPRARELAETMGFDSRPTGRTGQATVFTICSSPTLCTWQASCTS